MRVLLGSQTLRDRKIVLTNQRLLFSILPPIRYE